MNGTLKSLQVFIGILIGLLGLSGIAAGVGYYLFITQISTHPPKPVFAEEREGSKTAISAQASQSTVETDPNAIQELTPLAYDGKVIWKDGLSLRKEPDSSAEKVGTLAFEAKVAVIKTSDDKVWALVQPETEKIQGWIKASNIEKIAADDNRDPAAATPKESTKQAADDNQQEQPAPRRKRRRVRATPEPTADDNNPEEATPKQTRRKARVAPEPTADDNSQEQPTPRRTRRKPKAAPEPPADAQPTDGESSN
jgi:hypothetical protein